MSREVELDVEDQPLHPFLSGGRDLERFILKQRGLKVDDVAKEMGTSRSKAHDLLRGRRYENADEELVLALDRAITTLSDRQGGPLAMTGAGPDPEEVAQAFQGVLKEAWLKTNGFGLGSISSRIRRGTQ